MNTTPDISELLTHFEPNLSKEIQESAITQVIPTDTQILREGQYVKVIPFVINGLIKVFTRYEDRELLLYYIRPKESCIMSFAASLKNEPSQVFAYTEEETTALLLPVDKVSQWTQQFPDINSLFFQQYNLRYIELLDTIHHVLFQKMDQRVYNYLKEKAAVTKQVILNISHRQMANELGTAREVVSRVLKKLENEGKLTQDSEGIKLF